MQDLDLESAFAAYRTEVARMHRTGDWAGFAEVFTEDAVYRRHGYADFVGREAIRRFVVDAMTSFPGNQIAAFDVVWTIFEHAESHVVFELRHVMRDPGDGSHHAASTISMLTYAGGGLWSRCSDLHHLRAYSEMVRGWVRVAAAHDSLPPEQERLLAAFD